MLRANLPSALAFQRKAVLAAESCALYLVSHLLSPGAPGSIKKAIPIWQQLHFKNWYAPQGGPSSDQVFNSDCGKRVQMYLIPL